MNEPEQLAAVHHAISYIELPSSDLAATKDFYGAVFGWTFQDWGATYVAFHGAGIDGGFEDVSGNSAASAGRVGALVIMYSDNLEATQAGITAAGGSIQRAIFRFPGGRRFHFLDPSGNELAVWST